MKKEVLIDIVPPRTYHDLTELQREKMIEYYKNHTLKECAARWKISEEFGLPQFLTRANPKLNHGGARKKSKIPDKTEFEIHRDWLIQRIGSDGKGQILKLLKLYDDEKVNKIS
jgi:hypothetical protein